MENRITNREFFKNTPLHAVERYYFEDTLKGFNRGFSEWLSSPHYGIEIETKNGKLMMKGREYKGHFYTHDQFEEYSRLGMLP